MRGKGIKAVACSEGCTAAITSDGRMYTWGSGMAGQLGHGNMFRLPEPKLLSIFGDEVVIEQVSCGPYHTAAVSYDGTLYTWGNGLFGKLGHGDHESTFTPRPVLALAEHYVLNVSCGWWHTAAVGIPCRRGASPAPTPRAFESAEPGLSGSVSAPQLLLPSETEASATAAALAWSSAAPPTTAFANNAEQPHTLASAFPSLQSFASGDESLCSTFNSNLPDITPHSSSALSPKYQSQSLDVCSPGSSSRAHENGNEVGDCEEEGSGHGSSDATAAAAASAAMMRMSPHIANPTLLLRLDDSVTHSASSDSSVTSSSVSTLQELKVKAAAATTQSTAPSMTFPALPTSESPDGTDPGSGVWNSGVSWKTKVCQHWEACEDEGKQEVKPRSAAV